MKRHLITPARRPAPFGANPHWYKDAIIYEARVRSFFDSNGDGSAISAGLASKLDYLQDLGVTALWLLPFYPSPMRDDGYDIADYTDVHHEVGTLADFELFLDAGARARPPRHHRAGPEPHLRPAPVVQARAPRAARHRSSATSTSGATRPSATGRRASSSRTSSRRTGRWDPRRARLLLAPLLRAPARPELREPGGARGAVRRRRLLVRQGRRRPAAGRRPLPVRGGGDATARTCPRRTRS